MTPIPVVFDPLYGCGGVRHFARLTELYAAARHRPRLDWCAPTPGLALPYLERLHDPSYVQAFLNGDMPLAQSNYLTWSPALRDGVLAMLDGQLTAADHAWSRGIAVNLGIGFHHAHPDRGGGFCTFNGLALVALAHPERRICVLDSDEHGADGTEEFCGRYANLTNISLFGTRFGIRGGTRSIALQIPRGVFARSGFRTAVEQALEIIGAEPPDLLVFQAGADSHEADPRNSLALATADLMWRDRAVFGFCERLGIPVLTNFAGAYQSPSASGALYLNTLDAAESVFAVAS